MLKTRQHLSGLLEKSGGDRLCLVADPLTVVVFREA